MDRLWKSHLTVIVLLVCCAYGSHLRLSHDVVPESYEIKLHPDLENQRFNGEVKIFIRVKNAVKMITLHCVDLVIDALELDFRRDDVVFEMEPSMEFLHIMYENGDEIQPGEHTLYVKFNGYLNKTWHAGFYSYLENNSTLVASKMSQIYARRAFPCFDEPSFKAKFNVRLIKPDDSYTALSNMRHINSYPVKSGIIDEFQTSVPMSTYLVAFIITNFNYSETVYEQNGEAIPLRLYSLGTDEAREFPLVVAKEVMEYVTNYTGIDYPLPKLDMIEVANYRSLGMEHWGLVVFHKDSVVYNEETSPISKLRFDTSAALLIGHELFHFVFGNLVTHNWFSDLWLTEGFAKYMEFKAIDHVFPDWNILDFTPKILGSRVYQMDRDSDSLPLVSQVRTPLDVFRKYMGVLYPKGGLVLRMINHVLGEEKFQEAIQKYLKKFAYKSVSTGDLIDVFQSVEPDVNMFGFLDTWIYHNKYPIVIVSEDKESDTFNLTQECVPEYDTTTVCDQKWTIPIFYTTDNKREPRMVWFDKDLDYISIPKEGAHWIKINYKEIGIYRTNYDSGLWKKLSRNFYDFEPLEKYNLINDAFVMYDLDKVPCSVPLTLLEGMKGEIAYLPWAAVSENIHQFSGSNFKNVSDILQDYFISVSEEAFDYYRWDVKETDSIDNRYARYTILHFTCSAIRYQKCINLAWIKHRKNVEVHNDLRWLFNIVVNEKNQTEDEQEDAVVPEKVASCNKWIKTTLSRRIKHNSPRRRNAASSQTYISTIFGIVFLPMVLLRFT